MADGRPQRDENRRRLLREARLNAEAKQFICSVLDEVDEDINSPMDSTDVNHHFSAHSLALGKMVGYMAALSGWLNPRAQKKGIKDG